MRTELDKTTKEKKAEMEAAIGEVELLFDSICAAARVRESQLKEKFQQQFDTISESNRLLKLSLSRQTAAIDRFSVETVLLDQEPVCDTLSKAKSRAVLAAAALVAVEPFPTHKPFLFAKETELTTLFKTMKGQMARGVTAKKSSISPSLRVSTQESGWSGSPKPTHTKAYSSAASSPVSSPRALISFGGNRSPTSFKTGARSPVAGKLPGKVGDIPPRHGLKRAVGGREGRGKEEVVFVFGGVSERPTQIEVFHPNTHSWTQGGMLKVSRSSFATAVLPHAAVLLGGKLVGCI